MEGFDLKQFIDTFNFEQLIAFFQTGQYMALLHNPLVVAVGVVFIALIAYPKTRDVATIALGWTVVALVYGVGGVVLRNSNISEIGPFLLMMGLALGAVGYVLWTKLLRS
ncbi:MAG: hypothetical protein HZA04_09065 [Nitrospinae bacterium]|nr:hypothetical protein [Nitrospinota bacterium]